MRRVLEALFPDGAFWVPKIGGDLDLLLDGLGDGFEIVRSFLASLATIRDPRATIILDDLEREYGVVVDEALSDATRRTYLSGIKYGALGLGADSDVQARLRAAGFDDVYVYQNSPAIDPSGLPGAGVELLVTGELEDHPITFLFPILDRDWPFVFFVGGERTKHDNFIDWNMEYSGVLHWPDGNGAVVSKTNQVRQSGMRSLLVEADSATVTDQQIDPPTDDASFLSFYRMHEDTTVTGTRVVGLAPRNFLIDGAMNQTGVASWTAVSAVLTKESADPYSGRFCLRIDASGTGATGWATQARVLNGKDFLIWGRARSVDGTTSPRIASPGGNRWTGSTSTSWQSFSVPWTEGGGVGTIDLGMDTINGIVEFDDVHFTDINFQEPGATGSNLANVYTPLIEGLDFDPGSSSFAEIIDDCIKNGDFSAALGWTLGANWAIAAGVATFTHPGAGSSNLSQLGSANLAGVFIPGGLYRVTFTISNLAGACTCQPRLGGTLGTSRSANGTYIEDIRCGTGDVLDLIGTCSGGGGTFDVDDVLVELIDESFWNENLTIEAIVKQETLSASVVRGIAGNSQWASNRQQLAIDNGTVVFYNHIGGVLRWVQTAILDLDRYYHIVATREYDGTDTTLTIYVDGVSAASNSWTGAPDVTSWNVPYIGRTTGSGYLDGIIADHLSFYCEAKDSTWAAARFAEFQAALLAGPYASQELDPEVTDSRTLTAAAWAVSAASGDSLPVMLAQLPDDSWIEVFTGDPFSVDPLGLQAVSKSLADGIKVIRLYCKNAVDGEVAFDDVLIDNTLIARYDVLAELQDKFKRLILGAKPEHSWAGLLVDWVLYGVGSSAGSSSASGTGTVV